MCTSQYTQKDKKMPITNGLPCIIYASTRNFGVGKESAQQSTKVHFDDFFVSLFRNQIKYQIYQICKYLRNELLQQSESPKVSIDNWQILIIHISICYQIWILKLKIRSLRDSIFCIESSKMQQLAIEQDFHKKHLCAVTWKSFSLSSIFTKTFTEN